MSNKTKVKNRIHSNYSKIVLLEGPEAWGGGGVPIPFPSPFLLEIPLPSAQIPFPIAEFGKNPSATHTTSFRFAAAKLWLNPTKTKNSRGFTKTF